MALQGVDDVYDLQWARGVTYRDVRHRDEVEQSKYAFGQVDMARAEFSRQHREWFDEYSKMSQTLLASGLLLPALEYCLKCSHVFNVLDARGAVSVTERASYLGRLRGLARQIAEGWLRQREALGYPLLAATARA
jgi:glycyl-tRNA synthetase alpha chain